MQDDNNFYCHPVYSTSNITRKQKPVPSTHTHTISLLNHGECLKWIQAKSIQNGVNIDRCKHTQLLRRRKKKTNYTTKSHDTIFLPCSFLKKKENASTKQFQVFGVLSPLSLFLANSTFHFLHFILLHVTHIYLFFRIWICIAFQPSHYELPQYNNNHFSV